MDILASKTKDFFSAPEKIEVVEGNQVIPISSAFPDKEKREKYHRLLENTAASFLTNLKNFKG